MSSDPHAHASGHAVHDSGAAHGTFASYMTGFLLSVILTAIPFWLVMANVLHDNTLTALIIMGFAAVQILVHMVYFLHMSPKSEGGWSFTALVFTAIIVFIVLSGSLWVMYHLNSNMMPTHEMSQTR